MRRGIGIFAALALALALGILAMSASASAQETPDQGGGTSPGCAPEDLCTDASPPCEPIEICESVPLDCPENDPNVMCILPADCPEDVPCTEPGNPGCPPDVLCVDPPLPCDRPDGDPDCQFDDADADGWQDGLEREWGSDPNDANSTPEHGYNYESCIDGADNDGDGTTDRDDTGCQIDSDEDGRIDPDDNCPWDANADQADADGDGTGNACDYDADNDNWDDFTEADWGSNPNDPNSTPEHWFARETCEDGVDNDGDGATDGADPACAPDNDYDGTPDADDNCPEHWNEDQADSNGDGIGDACTDSDGDGFFDADEVAWGSDPNDATNVPEGGVNWEACDDGIDNDRDGTLDGDDEGCRVTLEDGGVPPDMAASGRPIPLSGRDGTGEAAGSPSLPLAGSGMGDANPSWVTYAVFAALAAVAGGASLYNVYARRRS